MSSITGLFRRLRRTVLWLGAAGLLLAGVATWGFPKQAGLVATQAVWLSPGQQYPLQSTLSPDKPVWLDGETPTLRVEWRNVSDQPVRILLDQLWPPVFDAQTGKEMGGYQRHWPVVPYWENLDRYLTTLQPGEALGRAIYPYVAMVGRWRVHAEVPRYLEDAPPGTHWPFEWYSSSDAVYEVVPLDMAKVTELAEFGSQADPRYGYPPGVVTYADFPGALYQANWHWDLYTPTRRWPLRDLQQVATDADPSTLQAKWEMWSGLSILYRRLSDPGVWTHDRPGAAPGYPTDFVVGPDDPAPELRRYFSPTGRAYWAVYFKGYVYATVRDALRPGFWTRAWITEEEALNPE